MIILFSTIILVVIIYVTLVQVMVAFVSFPIAIPVFVIIIDVITSIVFVNSVTITSIIFSVSIGTKGIDRFEDLVIDTSRETRRQNSQ